MLNLKIGIFVFRRDLRLDDNLGLLNMINKDIKEDIKQNYSKYYNKLFL